jgi:hypothetical protein
LSAGFSDSFNAKRFKIETIKSNKESAAEASSVILQLIIQKVNFVTASKKAQNEAIFTAFFSGFINLLSSF